jgi:hypothetical protein
VLVLFLDDFPVFFSSPSLGILIICFLEPYLYRGVDCCMVLEWKLPWDDKVQQPSVEINFFLGYQAVSAHRILSYFISYFQSISHVHYLFICFIRYLEIIQEWSYDPQFELDLIMLSLVFYYKNSSNEM